MSSRPTPGSPSDSPFLDIDDETWDRVLAVNLTGTFYTVQEAARVMAMQRKGSIVVTSSTNGFYVETNLAPYNASKGGIDALVRSAAIELAWHGIRVNAVAPSMVKTQAAFVTGEAGGGQDYLARVPMSRFADPPEIAAAVAFLASDEVVIYDWPVDRARWRFDPWGSIYRLPTEQHGGNPHGNREDDEVHQKHPIDNDAHLGARSDGSGRKWCAAQTDPFGPVPFTIHKASCPIDHPGSHL